MRGGGRLAGLNLEGGRLVFLGTGRFFALPGRAAFGAFFTCFLPLSVLDLERKPLFLAIMSSWGAKGILRPSSQRKTEKGGKTG
ncbi:MAG TPA: hypothetical protein PK881_04400 [Leptospiraceae bacterium]|nr:hypothetical protein [Leptospiraceae bacterium]HNJ33461.1 hypothetical protein [Leptospiraceae bacterium]